jgi:hypothetical protein
MTRSTAVTGVLAASMLVLSGCGGQEPPPGTSPATTVTVTATPTPTTTATPAAPAGEVHLFTYLQGHRGYRDWSGAAEYDQDSDGRELEVHVRGLQALAGQSLTVYLDTARVGTMVVAPNGTAERAWETAHGDQVPTASVDDRLHLRAENGDVVLSGSFKPDLSD